MAGSGEIKMNYAQVDEMIALLRKTAQLLNSDFKAGLESTAKAIDGGALIGDAGTEFSSGIRGTLNPAIDRLAQKLEERARYVENEKAQLLAAISDSGNQYG